MPQLERIQAVADLDGLARLAAKGSAVGRCRCGVQEISAVIGQKTGQDLFGQLGIGEIFPCVQIGLGEALRHEQTALRCQTADDSLLCGNAECGISGAQILHTFTPFLLFSFLYMYKPFLALYRCCERRIAGGYGIRPYGLQGSMSVIAPESVRLPQGSLPHPLRREPPRRGGQGDFTNCFYNHQKGRLRFHRSLPFRFSQNQATGSASSMMPSMRRANVGAARSSPSWK